MGDLDDLHRRLLKELLDLMKHPAYIAFHKNRTTMRPQRVEDDYNTLVMPKVIKLSDKLRLIVECDKIIHERKK